MKTDPMHSNVPTQETPLAREPILLAFRPATMLQVAGWISLLTLSAAAGPLDSWTLRSSGVTEALSVVTYGYDQYVAVGLQGTVLTSPDGATWTRRAPGTTRDIYGVCYGAGQYVAVGPGGLVMTSPDAVSWTMRASGTTANLFTVTYGNGRFVSVGDVILTSVNGVSWSVGPLAGADALSGVTFANNQFLAAGGVICGNWLFPDVCPIVLTSPNGLNWTPRYPPGTGYELIDVAYGNSGYVAVGSASIFASPAIFRSLNSTAWTSNAAPTSATLNSVAFGEGSYVTVGNFGTIFSSGNSVNWTQRASPTSQTLYEVTFGKDSFVAVGTSGTIVQSGYIGPPRLLSSRFLPDGTFEVNVQAELGQSVRLQVSTDPISEGWIDLATFAQNQKIMPIRDLTATNIPARFYRAVAP